MEDNGKNQTLVTTYIRAEDKLKLEEFAKAKKRPMVDQLSVIIEAYEELENRKYVSE